jgi:hypothetical protein
VSDVDERYKLEIEKIKKMPLRYESIRLQLLRDLSNAYNQAKSMEKEKAEKHSVVS